MRFAARTMRAEAARDLGRDAGAALAGHGAGLGAVRGMVVAGYWPMADEIDPGLLMERLARDGASLALPAVIGREMPLEFRRWRPGERLDAGPHNTCHPGPKAPKVVPDLVLVPLLAFDRRGFRLGYGGGYYDRTLAALRQGPGVKAIGLAFATQEVERVPAEPWDQPLDAILTEKGLIRVDRR